MPTYAELDTSGVPVGMLKWLQYYTDITTLDTTSEPTLNQTLATLDQIEAEINGVLAAEGYATVPASGSASVNLLRGYVETEGAYKLYTQVYGPNALPEAVKAWHEDYRAFLSRLRRGEQYLPDQQPQSEDEPVFGIVRHPERDDTFTFRWQPRDWDEP
ncbi:MAG: hypothetical protein K8L91_27940 [Anaerolineae bacterium]|nr:hypothetical protein [Anaerolineae bacterium]